MELASPKESIFSQALKRLASQANCPNKMIIELLGMRYIYFLIAGFLLAQTVFSYAGGDHGETTIWIDFDGTIATSEAFENLLLAAYDSMTEEEATQYPPLSYYGNIYYAEYLNTSSTFGPRDNISSEIAFRSSPALHKLESDSFDRVADAGIFNHIRLSVLQEAAATVTIRDGFWKFVARAQDYNIVPRISSLNWSVRWIRLVLVEDLKKRLVVVMREGKKWFKEDLADTIEIYCSEILPNDILKANKLDFPTRLHTGWDKVELMRKHAAVKGKEVRRVLYFGDSTNDLPPLMLEPTTTGVVTGRDSEMNRTLTRFGIGLVGLDQSMEVQDMVGNGFLYQVNEFTVDFL